MIRSDFQSFFVSFQLIIPTKVFPFSNDMTYFNICMYMCRRPVSWANVWPTQNDVKGAVCGEAPSMHISYHPISYFQYDICMPWWANGTFKRIYILHKYFKWQRKFKWQQVSNEKSNSFSFPIQNCKWYFLRTISRFEWKIDILRCRRPRHI